MVAFSVVLDLPIVVVDAVFFVVGVEVGFDSFVDFDIAVPVVSFAVVVALAIATISVALNDFTFALAFVAFNVFIVFVGVFVGVDNSFSIDITVAVVAFAVILALHIVVADAVFFVLGIEVRFDFFVDFLHYCFFGFFGRCCCSCYFSSRCRCHCWWS